MKKGFTLVELSIVLVIIGILIGGILVAQSMINTTHIQSVVKDFSRYETFINNFQTKYNQLPGDSNLFPGDTGNNDGLIGDTGPGNYDDWMIESGMVWYDLSLGVGLQTPQGANYQMVTGDYVVKNSNCFQLNIRQNNDSGHLSCLYLTANTYTATSATSQNFFFYEDSVNGYYGNGHLGSLYPVDLAAIDAKLGPYDCFKSFAAVAV